MISDEAPNRPRIFLAHPKAAVVASWRHMLPDDYGWQVTGETTDLESLSMAITRPDIDVFLVATAMLALLPRGARNIATLGNPLALVVACAESPDWVELHAALDRGACDVIVPGEQPEIWQARVYRRYSETWERQRLLEQRAEISAPAVTDLPVLPEQTKRATTVMVCGGDGGTGKSFLSLQLAGMLSYHAAARVCLVDFDVAYGALGAALRQTDSHDRCLTDILPVLPELVWQHVASIVQVHPAGFSWLAGPAVGSAESDVYGLPNKLIEVLAEQFDVVIIDWPAPGPDVAAAALFDQTFLVLTPDRASAACARSLAARLGPPGQESRLAAIVNRCDRPGALKIAELERLSGLPVASAVPEDAGAGLVFDRDGAVLAERTELAITRSLVAAAQRIRPFDELVRPRRFWQRRTG